MSDTRWSLRASEIEGTVDGWHPTIIESTTGLVACGMSGCSGSCGLPGLVLDHEGQRYRAHGVMVATGLVFRPISPRWTGEMRHVTATESAEDLLRRLWQ